MFSRRFGTNQVSVRLVPRPSLTIAGTLAAALAASACTQSDQPNDSLGAASARAVEASNAALSALPVPALCGKASSLSSYAIYANSWIALGEGSRVTGAAVGVHRRGAPVPAGMLAQLALGPNAVVAPTELVVAPSVDLAAGAEVGAVQAEAVTGVGSYGPSSSFPGDTPSLPAAMAAVVGVESLRVPQDGFVYIEAPTSWSDVTVEAGGTLYLMAEGTYHAATLTVGPGAHVYANKPVLLLVNDRITIGGSGSVMPNPSVEHLTAKDLVIQSSNSTGPELANPFMDMGQGSSIRGLVIAPTASVRAGDGARLTGAVAVDGLNTGRDVGVVYEDGLEGSACRDLCEDEQAVQSGFVLAGNIEFFPREVPEGDYLVKYEDGCMKYNGAQRWTVHAIVGTYSWYLVGGSPQDVLAALPGTEGFSVDDVSSSSGFAAFEECVAANKAVAPIAVHHPGGPMGVYLKDRPYSDNIAGTPNPTWSVTRMTAHGGCGQRQ